MADLTQRRAKPASAMTRPVRLILLIATLLSLVAGGGYLGVQYRSAQHPASLSQLPVYPFAGSAYPVSDLTAQDRGTAQSALRALANMVEPGYHVTAARFLACSGEFNWDAIRSSVGAYLSDSTFHVQDAGQTPPHDGDLAYIAWARTSRLQRLINDTHILAAGIQHPIPAGRPGHTVHVYAYFQLEAAN